MLNHVVLMGRLTRDPEIKNTQSGLPVASFSLAVERDHAPQGEKRQADFINIVAWRGTAEFVGKYFQKGQLVAVSGRLQVRDWTDQNGAKRYATEVVAESVYFAEQKRDRDQPPAPPAPPQYQQAPQGPPQNQYTPPPQYQQQRMYNQAPNGAAYSAVPQQGQPTYQAYATPLQPSSFSELDYDDSDLPF